MKGDSAAVSPKRYFQTWKWVLTTKISLPLSLLLPDVSSAFPQLPTTAFNFIADATESTVKPVTYRNLTD